MKRPRKYRLPQPPRQTTPPGPPETTVLQPRSSVPAGPPVTPLPGSPAPEVFNLYPRGPKPDPNRPLIPSREEIEKLPRWARVAFAARCARRVLPLFRQAWPAAAAPQCAALRRAVESAEQAAATARPVDGNVTQVSQAAYAAHHIGASTAYVAGKVVEFAARAVAATAADDNNACASAITTYEVLAAVATLGTARIVTAPARDLDCLSRLARQQNWTDDTPVPPEAFGPMWDRDPPSWWREDAAGEKEGESSERG